MAFNFDNIFMNVSNKKNDLLCEYKRLYDETEQDNKVVYDIGCKCDCHIFLKTKKSLIHSLPPLYGFSHWMSVHKQISSHCIH